MCFPSSPGVAYSYPEIYVEDVLLIDDDVELGAMLTEYLAKHGFRVRTVHRGDTGLTAARQRPWALILLDVMLPGIDGFEVLRRIRSESNVSVLLLTARGEDIDRIVGLEIARTTTCPSPSIRASCWRACALFFAARIVAPLRPRRCFVCRIWSWMGLRAELQKPVESLT